MAILAQETFLHRQTKNDIFCSVILNVLPTFVGIAKQFLSASQITCFRCGTSEGMLLCLILKRQTT